MEADPGWAERRYRNALRDRKVVAYLADDGSAVVVASGLPADQTAAAYANLDAVARAAKRAGADASMDRLRADLFVGLLDQRWNGWTREQLVAELVALHPRRRDSRPAAMRVPKPRGRTRATTGAPSMSILTASTLTASNLTASNLTPPRPGNRAAEPRLRRPASV
ncbi:MAG: hypothetical protein ACTHMS_17590 [Jatrophihabitans sp.]|uniref:hypothetical protein n=1 Tax=Jatrophihabitans sp. TaxID=1932789 RepID=UPI003F807A5C